MIEEIVAAPGLQSKLPVAVVDNTEFPQLLATDTTGATGVLLGEAELLPVTLVHPLTVTVTLYVPATPTVIEGVVAPVLQSNEPVAVVDKVEVLLQLSTSVTVGPDGVLCNAATPVPAALLHPLKEAVTE